VSFLLQDNNSAQSLSGLLYFGFWNIALASLLVAAHAFAERSHAAAGALHGAELRRLGLTRELDSARLQLLQAQVEPHFLFNALANVRRLLRTDADAARTLLGDLLRYLQEALPALRDEHTTLAREAELVRAFLAVHQVRMGPRLQAHIHIPPELATRTVPPMVLLTLVENALKHGLQPLVDGGSVVVSARAENGRLTLTVADTGRGMGSGSGGGTGLANLRARLKSLHGGAASLSLAVNLPRGVVATVVLPDSETAP
jgi:LytS/YehU family sensor histidine kinase